jgi:KTSC domain
MPTMPRMFPVDSSAVIRIGYDARAEEAYVEYQGSGAYAYLGVPPGVFAELIRAESKGAFVNDVIKRRYPFRRL